MFHSCARHEGSPTLPYFTLQVVAQFVEDTATGVAPTLQLVSRNPTAAQRRRQQQQQQQQGSVQMETSLDQFQEEGGNDAMQWEGGTGGDAVVATGSAQEDNLGVTGRIQTRSIIANQSASAFSFARGEEDRGQA